MLLYLILNYRHQMLLLIYCYINTGTRLLLDAAGGLMFSFRNLFKLHAVNIYRLDEILNNSVFHHLQNHLSYKINLNRTRAILLSHLFLI